MTEAFEMVVSLASENTITSEMADDNNLHHDKKRQEVACQMIADLGRRLKRARAAWNRTFKWTAAELDPLGGQEGTAELLNDLERLNRIFEEPKKRKKAKKA